MRMKKLSSILISVTLLMQGVTAFCVENEKLVYDTSDVKNIFVKTGAVGGNGLFNKPFSSLEDALAKVIKLRTIYPDEEIRIMLMGGEYEIKNTINLSAYGGANDNSRLKIMAYNGETPVLKGSTSLDKNNFYKVTDEKILERLDEGARENVLCMSLGEYDFSDKNPADMSSYLKIYSGNKEQPIAQWPNGEHNYSYFEPRAVGGTNGNDTGEFGSFSCVEENPFTWKDASDAVAFGYFGYDYRAEAVNIGKIDAKSRRIELGEYTDFGVRNSSSRRWKAYNVLEELDSPGEWYVDRDNKLLYYYPTDEFENENIEISVMSNYMFDLKNTSNVTFEGITFKNTSGGIMSCYTDDVSKSSNITVDKCTFENIGGTVFNAYTYKYLPFYDYANYQNRIGNISNLKITNNIFYNFYSSPLSIYSGNIETREVPGVTVYNNYSNQPAALSEGAYLLGSVYSVESEVKNNLLHNAPFHVLGADGYNNKIMYNEVVSTVRETADAGAFYVGRTVMHRDNEYAYNLFYKTAPEQANLKAFKHNRAIYFDDGYSGGYVHDNISVDGDKSFHTSGAGNRYENNISVDSFMWFEIWNGVDRYSKLMGFADYGKDISGIDSSELENYEMTDSEKAISERAKAFLNKFPQIEDEYSKIKGKNFQVTANNVVKGNLTVNANAPDSDWSNDMREVNTVKNNITITDSEYSMFVNPEELDFRVKKDSDAYKLNSNLISEDFDLNKIGLQEGFDKNRILEKRSFKKLYPEGNMSVFSKGAKIEFLWEKSFDADRYRIEIAKDEEFQNIIVSEEVSYNHFNYVMPNISREYYWRVYAINETRSMKGEWLCNDGVSQFSVGENNENEEFEFLKAEKDMLNDRIKLYFTKMIPEESLDLIKIYDAGKVIDVDMYFSESDDNVICVNTKELPIDNASIYQLVIPADVESEGDEMLGENIYISISNKGIFDDFNNEESSVKWRNNTSTSVKLLDNSMFMGNYTVNSDAANIPYNQGCAWIRLMENDEYSFEDSVIEFDYQNNADGNKYYNGAYENFRVFMRVKNASLDGSTITSDGGYFLELSQYGKLAGLKKWDGSAVSIGANQGKIGENLCAPITVNEYEYCSKVRYKITIENLEDSIMINVYMAQYKDGLLGEYKMILSAEDKEKTSLSGCVYFGIDSSDMNKYQNNGETVYGYGYINSHQIDNYKFYSTSIENVSNKFSVKDVKADKSKITIDFTGPVKKADKIRVKNNKTGEMIADAAQINPLNSAEVLIPYTKIKGDGESYSLFIEKGIESVTGELAKEEKIYDLILYGAGYSIENDSLESSDFKVYYPKDSSVSGIEKGIPAHLKDGWIFMSKKAYGKEIFEENTSYSGGAMVMANDYSKNFIEDSVLEFDYKNLNYSSVTGNGNYSGMRIFLRSGEITNTFSSFISSYRNKISSKYGSYIVTLYRNGNNIYSGLKKWDGKEYNITSRVDDNQNITTTLLSAQKICDYFAGDEIRIRIEMKNMKDSVQYVMYVGKYIDGAVNNWKKVMEFSDTSNPIFSGGVFFTACGSNAAYTNGYISSNYIKDINYWNYDMVEGKMLAFGERKVTDAVDGKVKLNQKVLSRYLENRTADICYAMYDSSGRMIYVTKKNVEIIPGENSVEFEVPENLPAGCIQKVFIWKGNIPLVENAEF